MKIQILEKPLNIEDKYLVAINGRKKFVVEGYSGFFTQITISSLEYGQSLSVFRKILSITPSYNIYVNNERISDRKAPLKFRTGSFLFNRYYCNWDNDKYEIFIHKKLKYSIFKNNVQIAGIREDLWNMVGQDSFTLECNSDCIPELIIAFTIIIDHIYTQKISFLGGLLTGSIGVMFQAKMYDETWQPV